MDITDLLTSEIIAMAWDDKTSFDMIEKYSGLSEQNVITLMQQSLKSSSFKLWRKRVTGRKLKHEKRNLDLQSHSSKITLSIT